jgi:hypothetical protein
MTDEQIARYIESVSWRTSVDGSHQYTLVANKPDLKTVFSEFVMHIRKNGYVEEFTGWKYTYFDIGGYQYWTMGAPLEETILINRAQQYVHPA